MESSGKDKLTNEYTELLRRAENQPGVNDLMEAYGRYQELVKQSQEYLSGTKGKTIISNTNSTS